MVTLAVHGSRAGDSCFEPDLDALPWPISSQLGMPVSRWWANVHGVGAIWFSVGTPSRFLRDSSVWSCCVYVCTELLRRPNHDLMLGHRLRRWPNIRSALGQRHVRSSCIDSTVVYHTPHKQNRFYGYTILKQTQWRSFTWVYHGDSISMVV